MNRLYFEILDRKEKRKLAIFLLEDKMIDLLKMEEQ